MGDRLIKRYRKAGETIILESDNRKYEPLILTPANGEGVRIFHVAQIIMAMQPIDITGYLMV